METDEREQQKWEEGGLREEWVGGGLEGLGASTGGYYWEVVGGSSKEERRPGGRRRRWKEGGRGRREAAGRPLKVTPEESDSSRLPSKLLLFIHI